MNFNFDEERAESYTNELMRVTSRLYNSSDGEESYFWNVNGFEKFVNCLFPVLLKCNGKSD